MRFFFTLILIITSVMPSVLFSQIFHEQEKKQEPGDIPPVIAVSPAEIKVMYNDSTEFVTKEVNIYNKGGGALHINNVEGSCGCSMSTVLTNDIYPLSKGNILLNINLEGLENGRIVEYLIYSNARNSPFSIRVYFEKEGEKKETDSTKVKTLPAGKH